MAQSIIRFDSFYSTGGSGSTAYTAAGNTMGAACIAGDVILVATLTSDSVAGVVTITGPTLSAGPTQQLAFNNVAGSTQEITFISAVASGSGTPVIKITTPASPGDPGLVAWIIRGAANGTIQASGTKGGTGANFSVASSPANLSNAGALYATWYSEVGNFFTSFNATAGAPTQDVKDINHLHAAGHLLGIASGTAGLAGLTNSTAASNTFAFVWLSDAATGIAFDASSNSGDQSSVSTFTFSRTVTLANPFLALDVGLLSTPSATVTAIDDFGGGNVNIPIIGSQVATGIGLIVQFGLANPAAGTKTIQVNLSTSLTSGAVATIYGNVDQIEPTEAFNSAQGLNVGAANASVTVTPVTDKTWIHAATSTNDPAATNNQTSRGTVTDAVLGRVLAEDNNAAVTPAAATTMTAAIAAAKAWAIAGYAIKPTGSADLFAQICL